MKDFWIIGIMLALIVLVGCTSTSENKATGNFVGNTDDGTVTNDNSDKLTIYFFWGNGCPHCAEEKQFLEKIEEKYPELNIKSFEVYQHSENRDLLQELAQAYNTTFQGVPVTFIGEKHWVGFSEQMGTEMEEKAQDCLENDCMNPGDKLE
ncbi:MAG: glutaredoxin family protein [Nanobdellota archaeon]